MPHTIEVTYFMVFKRNILTLYKKTFFYRDSIFLFFFFPLFLSNSLSLGFFSEKVIQFQQEIIIIGIITIGVISLSPFHT